MLRRFLTWIEEYVVDVGVVGLIGPLMGILAFAGTLSVLTGSAAIKAGLLVALLLTVVALQIALVTRLRALNRQNAASTRQLKRYCDVLRDIADYALHISYWDQVAVVARNGDTTETITIHATVSCQELYYFRLRFGPAWNQPEKYRKRVSVDVRSVILDGAGGTRWNFTKSWLPSGRMEVIAHFHTPARMGSDIRITMLWHWPGKCVPLVRYREPDSFTVHFRDMIDKVRYAVVLPTGEDAFYDAIGFDINDKACSITSERNSQGNTEIVFTGHNVPKLHQVGMLLDLK